MKNEEKFKTAEERENAFDEFCSKHASCGDCLLLKATGARCGYQWLELEAEEDGTLPCPICGGGACVRSGTDDYGSYWEYVKCLSCGLTTTTENTEGAAVAKWNRRINK